jgi:hypothetical protein
MRRVGRGVAVLTFVGICLLPVAAWADAGEIRVPPGAPQLASDEAKMQPPIGFWDVLLLVWLEAKIGPPGG